MADHMKYLFLGMLLGVGIPFFVAGLSLQVTGFKIYIGRAEWSTTLARAVIDATRDPSEKRP